ncbi:DUF5714 domain-containing protein [Methanosalsum natronophilum]|uniref:Radical SAM protein n=1 Tax=Methanosalsum natronophilum TaxID=768733 RepID=A0A424YUW1_9EURY|nr:DUF5714 domain-containing protein [Methanosalsum natronophilum]MCS3924775.1 Zn finger protein HypA/HybF involved in hydrogenase expression [Methanosalsum natronophilum]RQD82898.1 MAG: radical SAM protein [Methanosalsum natronophilum]
MINLDTASKSRSNCMICNSEIKYENESVNAKCHYCGHEEDTRLYCKNGHYVCNECHSKDSIDIIHTYCLNTAQDNPFEIAETIMRHQRVPMHGPEHHALVAATLVTAYQNRVGIQNSENIIEAIKRGKTVPGGYCGYFGACGASVGAGIALSILTEATPLTPEQRSHSMWVTAKTLNEIADAGGARCCKKAIRLAIGEATKYISELFQLEWDNDSTGSFGCEYDILNKECDSKCLYKKIK